MTSTSGVRSAALASRASIVGGRIGDHHRTGLRIDGLDLADAVVFLHRRGVFVLADAVAGVIGDRGGDGEPGLLTVAPGQPVDVVAGLRVADQDAGRDHAAEVLRRLGVDGAVVRVGRRIEIDLGLRDVQEAPRFALGAFACLGAGQHVIGRRQDLAGPPRRRAEGTEGSNERQSPRLVALLGRPGLAQGSCPQAQMPSSLQARPPAASRRSRWRSPKSSAALVVNADSMQVYRDLRIITARPDAEEEARVPHRLYGHVDAAENFSVGRWMRRRARGAGRGKGAGADPDHRRRHRPLFQGFDQRPGRRAADSGGHPGRRSGAARARRALLRCMPSWRGATPPRRRASRRAIGPGLPARSR